MSLKKLVKILNVVEEVLAFLIVVAALADVMNIFVSWMWQVIVDPNTPFPVKLIVSLLLVLGIVSYFKIFIYAGESDKNEKGDAE